MVIPQEALQSDSNGSSTGIAQRARHPDEFKKDHGDWLIDIDYYLSQQIHPVVSQLCAFIQGTSSARLAECMGLDSSRFQHKTTEANGRDPIYLGVANDEERFCGCDPLSLACPSCSSSFECSSIASFICTSRAEEFTSSHAEEEPMPKMPLWGRWSLSLTS